MFRLGDKSESGELTELILGDALIGWLFTDIAELMVQQINKQEELLDESTKLLRESMTVDDNR